MKRRGFFGALTGLIAAPIAAKAVESIPDAPKGIKPADIVVTKYVKGPHWEDDATCISGYYDCTIGVSATSAASWENDDEEDEY